MSTYAICVFCHQLTTQGRWHYTCAEWNKPMTITRSDK
jgi:hypothetical protein